MKTITNIKGIVIMFLFVGAFYCTNILRADPLSEEVTEESISSLSGKDNNKLNSGFSLAGQNNYLSSDTLQRTIFNPNEANGRFGCTISNAGDVNGDGFDDFITGAIGYPYVTGKAYIYFGGLTVNTTPDIVLTDGSVNNHFGYSVSTAGDFNGDGYSDVIVGAKYTANAYIYLGGTSMDNVPDIILSGVGEMVSTAGDVNGDGYSDVITSGGFIFFGGAAMNNVVDVILYGGPVSTAGDVNGDGYDDVIVGAGGADAHIFFGGVFMDNIPDVLISTESIYDFQVSDAGDVNGDGFSDVIVGNAAAGLFSVGKAFIYFGGINMDNIADITMVGTDNFAYFGYRVSSAGDVNNDGYSDVIVGSWKLKTFLYFGGSSMDNIPDEIMATDGSWGSPPDHSISSAGDFDGDGQSEILIGIGAYNYPSGIVHFYDFIPSAKEILPDMEFTGENPLDYFGVCTNPAGDVNGDGYDDFIIGAPDYNSKTGRAYLYYGGSSPDSIPDVIFNGETSWYPFFGNSATGAGDLNRDGYDDIIIGAYGYSGLNGRAYIFYGGVNMDNIPDLVLEGEQIFNVFGMQVAKAGDVNGDGFPDVIVGARGYNNWTGRAYIFFGGTNMNNVPDITMTGEVTDDQFGFAVSSAGDVNADGYSDVVVGAYRYGNNTGRAYLYFGGNAMNNIPDMIMTGEGIDNNFGAYAASAGDVNNDGYSDIVIGADEWDHSTNKVYIYFGGATPDNIPDLKFNGENPGDHFAPVFNNDDFNGDSYSDVFIGAWGFNNKTGKAYIFNGSSNMDTNADLFMNGQVSESMFGGFVSAAGDVNGDDYPDLLVGANAYQNSKGKAYLYFGSGDPVKTLSELTSSPEFTIAQMGTPACISGLVKNKLNQTLSNIRINFFVKGANSSYGSGFSDGNGIVQYCYNGIYPGTDTIIAVSGKLRDTSFVFWESNDICIYGSSNVIMNSTNLYTAESNSLAYFELSNFDLTEARIVSDAHNDSVFVDAGNQPGHYVLYYVTPDIILCSKHVYVDNPLPVELASFTSAISGRNVTLNWSTVSELNNSGFDIEKSIVKGQTSEGWSKIGFINGSGTISEPQNYSFTDKNLTTGKYKYRLKQIDFNGNFEYFNLAEEVSIGIPDKYELSQNYPNPFNPVTNLEYGIAKLGFVSLKIYDVLGRELVTLVNEIKEPGYYKIKFNAADLSSGVYFYRMTAGLSRGAEDYVAVKKFVVMK